MQDPDPYLHNLDIHMPCAVDEFHEAAIDSAHRRFVNYEVFFFADDQALRRFESDPLRYCGILTDPVSRLRFRPIKSSPQCTHNDRRYYFLSDSTFEMFAKMPEMYVLPDYQMLPKDTTESREG